MRKKKANRDRMTESDESMSQSRQTGRSDAAIAVLQLCHAIQNGNTRDKRN